MTLPEQNGPTRACFVPESKDFTDSPGCAGKGSPVLREGHDPPLRFVESRPL